MFERPYRPPAGRMQPRPMSLLLAALLFMSAYYSFAVRGALDRAESQSAVENQAIAIMERGLEVIAEARLRAGYGIDEKIDPNQTGLIGVEWSSTTTTLGDLAAKRTATHPRWAAAAVRWMQDAGVRPGDIVWASFSGSFPGLNLAVLAAAEAVGAELVAVSSLGASTWGANLLGFPWSDMERALHDAGVVSGRSVALTLGGDEDKGPAALDLFGDGETSLRAAAARSGLPLKEPADLAEAVRLRLEVLSEASEGRTPALFVNVGGGHASFGNCKDAHAWPTGLSFAARSCLGTVPGMLYEAADRGIPVLHLLNIKPLAVAVGIPVDARFRVPD